MKRIIAFVEQRRALFAHWFFGAAVVAPMFCLIAAAWAFEETGSWGSVRFFVLYALPLFVAAPLWARARVQVIGELPLFALVTDATVLVLSIARFAASGIFPFSGHMLFLTYTVLTTRARWYRWLALALIVETTVFKVLWRDYRSWSIGLLLGLAVAVLVLVVTAQHRKTLERRVT